MRWEAWSIPAALRSKRPMRSAASTAPPSATSCGASAMPARAAGLAGPHAYLELHIEQGPVLEDEGLVIGAVEGITGLSWIGGLDRWPRRHAGTTPMHLRHDAAYAAAEIVAFVRRLAREMGGAQRGTVGRIEVYSESHQRRRRAGGLDGRPAQPRRRSAARQRSARSPPCSSAWPRRRTSRSPPAAWDASRRFCSRLRWWRWSRPLRASSATAAVDWLPAPATMPK